MGCIWAKVTYGYPTGSLTVGAGGPSGSISGGHVRRQRLLGELPPKGQAAPAAPRPVRVGYAKALLNSSTLELCTSRSKRQGPRFCSFQKFIYGD